MASSTILPAPMSSDIDRDNSLVTLSLTNKEFLFEHAIRNLEAGVQEAMRIYLRLGRFCPDLFNSFQLRTSADITKAPFRLVCSNDSAAAADPTVQVSSYIALSYCWRSDDWNAAGSSLARPKWPISSAFVDAVLAQRAKDEGIWMDQLCIRQEDTEEKMLAIASMDIIYSSARRLLIILEDVQLSAEEEAIVMKYNWQARQRHLSWDATPQENILLASAFRKFTSARWFSRAWCWHELEVHHHHSEERVGSFPEFLVLNSHNVAMSLCRLFIHQLRIQISAQFPPDAFLDYDKRWAMTIDRHLPNHSWGASNASLMSRYHSTMSCDCSVPSDRISIAINLSGLSLLYCGVASTKEKCYWIFSLLAIAAGDMAPLTFVKEKHLEIAESGAIRSWIFEANVAETEGLPSYFAQALPGIRCIRPESIELDLLFLECPMQIPCRTSYETLRRIFRNGVPEDEYSHEGATTEAAASLVVGAISPGLLRGMQLFALACALDNGVNWMLKAWNIFDEELVRQEWNPRRARPFSANPLLRDAANGVLRYLGADDRYYQPVLCLLTFMLDHHSADLFNMPISRVRTSAAGDQGLLTCAFGDEQMDWTKCRLAVPRALVESNHKVRKVWLLEEISWCTTTTGKSSWRLVGKARLLGCPHVVPDPEPLPQGQVRAVSLKRDQVVYGDAASAAVSAALSVCHKEYQLALKRAEDAVRALSL